MVKLDHQTDEVLVKKYIDGCNAAFDVLLSRYKNRLYNYITFHLHQHTDMVDDVFQETFVKAIITLKENRYTHQEMFLSWLMRIAHNLIMDYYREEAQLKTVSNDDEEVDLLNDAELVDTYQELTLINEQTLKDVKRLMNNLPENQREVVFMRYYQNLSFKEIADITGVSINTSLGRMRYALINMRKMAEDHDISLEIL